MFGFSTRKLSTKDEAVEDQKSSTALTLASPTPELFELFGAAPNVSGVSVSPDNTMRVPAVRAAVYAISEALGQVDAQVYSTEDAKPATDHPAYGLLHDAANEWTSASTLREQLTFDALRHGNGFGAIVRDGDGAPVEIHRLQPDRVTGLINQETLEPYYQFSPLAGSMTTYDFRDVLHLRAPSINGIFGDSPVRQCCEAIAASIIMERMANGLFANGARPSGVLETLKKVGAEAANNLKASWRGAFGGKGTGGLGVLEDGLTYKNIGLSSVDAQFLEMRTFAINDVARIFRISPIMLGELGRATFNNSEEMSRQFVTYTLMPWVIRWQDEAELKLFAPEDRGKFRVELDTDDLVVPDFAARAKAFSSMVAARIMNPNECRALEGRAPYPGGDEFINPNVTTTENVNVG